MTVKRERCPVREEIVYSSNVKIKRFERREEKGLIVGRIRKLEIDDLGRVVDLDSKLGGSRNSLGCMARIGSGEETSIGGERGGREKGAAGVYRIRFSGRALGMESRRLDVNRKILFRSPSAWANDDNATMLRSE